MRDAPAASNDLIPGLTHHEASGAHPVAPAAGSYIVVDLAPLLAASAPGPISPVLVLPRADDPPGWMASRAPDGVWREPSR
jgi:hypothetical protein